MYLIFDLLVTFMPSLIFISLTSTTKLHHRSLDRWRICFYDKCFKYPKTLAYPTQFFFLFLILNKFPNIFSKKKKKTRSKFETKKYLISRTKMSSPMGEYYFLLHLSRLVLVFLKKFLQYMCYNQNKNHTT